MDKKCKLNGNAYVIFNNYNVKSPNKNARKHCTGGTVSQVPEYKIDNHSRIRNFRKFLSINKTKYLALYLTQKLIEKCKCAVTTVTCMGVLINQTP